MARIRTIKPQLPQDADLARLSRHARYHFVLLWTVCDDGGFFRALPRLLLGQLYPHDRDVGEAEVDALTAQLADAGFIEIRQSADGPIGYVTGWPEHQKIDRPSSSHLREIFDASSRTPRESPSQGVLSPESLVLSPETATSSSAREALLASVPKRFAWEAELNAALQGMHGVKLTPEQIELACRDYIGNGHSTTPTLAHFRAYLRRAAKPDREAPSDNDNPFASPAVLQWAAETSAKEKASA